MNIRQTIGSLLFSLLLQAGALALITMVVRWYQQRARHRQALDDVRALPWHDADAIVLLGVLLAMQLLSMALGPLLAADAGLPSEVAPAVVLLAQALMIPLVSLTVLAVLIRRRGIAIGALTGIRNWRECRSRLGFGSLCYLSTLPFVAAAAVAAIAMLQSLNYPIAPQPILDLLIGSQYPLWLRITIMATAVTLIPITEEAIFRGVFLPLALRRASPPVAVAGVSFMFAALHMHIPSMAPLFVLAAAFSTAYLMSGSLAVPIVMHALFNGISLIAMLIAGDSVFTL